MTQRPCRTMTAFVMLVLATVVGLSGCDYWPPSLQAQIDQLRAEAQVAAAERASLETSLAETVKLKDSLQARVDDLTRQNQELTMRVSGLEKTLVEREKSVKAGKPAKQAPAAKSTRKPPAKTTAKSR